jgi:hypothetical protein
LTKTFFSNLFFLICFSSFTRAQESSPAAEMKKHYLPVISIAEGMLNFSGDVGYSHLNEPLLARTGLQFEIQPYTEKRFSFSLFYLNGKVFGDEKTVARVVNFSSRIQSAGLMFRYDFISSKSADQIIIPFLTVGAEYLMFKSYTDLKDASGNTYNYWSDGSIRNIAEDDPAADQSVVIYRDYTYETDLRDANLDGFGKFKTSTWGIPAGAGFRFKISDRCALHFSSVYHMTGSDYIDGITVNSKGNRQGDDKNDNFFYTSVAFRFSLSKPKEENAVDFNALVNEDADGDGIPDIKDDSSGTPQNSDVSVNGKPVDKDNDGIPDYRDKEPESESDAVVNEDGVTITEEMIEAKFRKDSLSALPAVIEYLRSYDKLTQRNPDVEKKWMDKNTGANAAPLPEIPPLYKPLDKDKNGIITPKEISTAIDDYLGGKSNYSVSQFFDLIDFFFTQH